MLCRLEMFTWIAAEFDWAGEHSSLEQTVDVGVNAPRKPRLLGQFDIQMTLTTRPLYPYRAGDQFADKFLINELCLTYGAFKTRSFTVQLEKGCFMTPLDARFANPNLLTQYYGLRLLFDQSPFPERENWKMPGSGPEANCFYDIKEFAGRQSKELQRQVENPTWWDSLRKVLGGRQYHNQSPHVARKWR